MNDMQASAHDLLKQAVAAARGGREWTARDIFLRVVEMEPCNEIAWMWLSGLLDDLDDRIYACEQILKINAGNVSALQYLNQLLAERRTKADEQRAQVEEKINWVKNAVETGDKSSALAELRRLAEQHPQVESPDLWRMFADISPELEERVKALERLAELLPNDVHLRQELEQARYYLQNPIHQAELYEEHGESEKALEAYRKIAANTDAKSKEWQRIFWKINELENLKHEKIAHVSPALNIARLTAGPPLVYFMFLLVHVGINPFAYFDPIAWFGLLWVAFGSFLVALAAVRSHNRLWTLLFKDVGAKGSPATRRALSLAGWSLIALPHVFLLIAAAYRLLSYRVSIP